MKNLYLFNVQLIMMLIILILQGNSWASESINYESRYRQVSQTNRALVQGYRYLALLNDASSTTDLHKNLHQATNLVINKFTIPTLIQSPSRQMNFSLAQYELQIISPEQSILTMVVDYHDNEERQVKNGRYAAKLIFQTQEGFLPLLEKIEEENLPESDYPDYSKVENDLNRIKSLVYYWTSLLDSPQIEKKLFLDLLDTDSYQLAFDATVLDNNTDFNNWFNQRFSKVKRTSRIIDHLAIEALGNNTYKITFKYDLRGETQTGKTIIGLLKQEWIILNNKDTYPKIKQIIETFLIPKIDTGIRIRC